jgi:sugar O-acyltransferase (sialic acid O-acetyltransferase NeuD family)
MSGTTAQPLTIFGVSNMIGDILDCAIAAGYAPRRIVVNQPEQVRPRTKSLRQRLDEMRLDVEVTALDAYAPEAPEICFLGTTAERRSDLVALLEQRFSPRFARLVHPRASVSPFATVADGVFIGAGAVIASGVRLGAHAFINRSASIGHDTEVGAFARLMPACNVGGHVRIGDHATIGLGASVVQELVIGAQTVVAIGAVVTRDLPPNQFAAGTPARGRPRETGNPD